MPLSISPRRDRRGSLALAMLALFGLVIPAGVFAAKPVAPPPVTIQLLNVSDWHGNVDPVSGTGGAWNISARWDEDSLAYPSLRLTAGDDFGASPALVGFFNEEPSIKAQRLMGIQVGALGNHNWDRGNAHLQQMINLAGAPSTGSGGSAPGDPYSYVSANLKNLAGNLEGVEPYRIFDVGGVDVAVIGITNEEAPGVVLPGAFGTIQITDGVAAANKAATEARREGADVVVVITHKGVRGFEAGQPWGELIDFANGVSGGQIDVILGDHTDVQWSGTINGILVHENRSFGITYAKTLLTVQPGVANQKSKVLSKSVTFVSPSPAGALSSSNTSCGALVYCDQDIVTMLVPYRQSLAQLLDQPIAKTTAPFARGGNIERRQEVPQGDLIADGMRWRYGTQLGFMNGGSIRSAIPTCGYQPVNTALNRATWSSVSVPVLQCSGYGSTAPWDIVLGDLFTTQPFGNSLNTRTVTGAQLWLALENGVRGIDSSGNGGDGRFPQISGFRFAFRYDIPSGCTSATSCTVNRVQWVTLSDGTPIPNDASATYTMTLPNFINVGGDGYYMFADGQGASQELDVAVMRAYIESFGATAADRLLDPSSYPLDRIIKCNGPCS